MAAKASWHRNNVTVTLCITEIVNARCDELATVVGRNKLTVLVAVGLGQFITLSIQLCVQHDAREAARRAGPSAAKRRLGTLDGGLSLLPSSALDKRKHAGTDMPDKP